MRFALLEGMLVIDEEKQLDGKSGKFAVINAHVGDVPVSAVGQFTHYFKKFAGQPVVAFCEISTYKNFVNLRCLHVVKA